MKINTRVNFNIQPTHEGGHGFAHRTPMEALRR
eukprot:CAMPEP_0201256598 /NCGR_PEP_ID=MMETSP0853-20130426/810_1 /ASSEMBLY_ACC=CAM_ASM_000640 /TAXON_ID=183588 /ORGANISM="Pseudo-nitzschia fraudulenta, Strain WWA7" /LENGTH=32 /DNA_ID= /DNA_START= /DNA_END= /DNA_ORIENTATION=